MSLMRLLASLIAVVLALVPVACGGDEDGTGSESEELQAKIDEYLAGPKIHPPPGPPPKKLVVKNLKVGAGPVAKEGDQVTLHYIAVAYEDGAQFSRRWDPDPPAVYPRLGKGPYEELEEGIEGMREGGRRELIVPNYAEFALIYVVDLEKVEPAAKSGRGA